MALDREAVARIAELARIEVPEAELEALAGELSHILGWIEQLGEVDTEGVEPLRSVMPLPQRWRADEVTDGARRDAVTANAPKGHDGFFVVPRVVE